MTNIYELTQAIQRLWDLMEDGEIDDETLIDAMANSQEDLTIKLEGYCKFIKNLETDISGLKEEEHRLSSRRKTMEKTVERAKKAMQWAMNEAGEKKIPCGSFTVSVQKNPESVVMDTDSICDIPSHYLKFKDPEIDKAKLKEDLKNGDMEAQLIAHLEQTESVRIR